MKIKKFFISLGLLAALTTPVSASESELTIYMEVLYYNISMTTVDCDRLIYIQAGKNLSSFNNLPCHLRDGKVTATLTGPAGTSVTLFGNLTYGQDKGYIVIRKTDERMIWLRDLMDFPDSKWKTIEGDSESGGYEVFYKAGPAFDSNIASLKWGQWWAALP